MSTFLVMLGFITILFFASFFIYSLIRKNGKVKKSLLGIFVSFVLMVIGGMISEEVPNNTLNKNIASNKTQIKEENISSKVAANTLNSKQNIKNTSETLKIHYINVGQADSILIQQNDHNMLIDAGNNEDSSLVINYLKKQGVSKIDYVIGTHPHEDHIGGLDAVIDNFNVNKIFLPKVTSNTKTFKDVITSIKNKSLNITTPKVGSSYLLGNSKWFILAPNNSKYQNANNYSIVIKLTYNNNSFMFTGDAEDISETEILKKGFNLKSDVLKVGHHGSSSSSSLNFLKSVNPKYAVISVEKGNVYGHPHKDTMDKLKNMGIKVYRTDQNGTIICTCDGNTVSFNCNNGDYSYSSKGNCNSTKVSNISPDTSNNIKDNKIKNIDQKNNTIDKNDNSNKNINLNVTIKNIDKKGELVTITNESSKDINLNNWKLISVTGNQQYTFPSYTLKSKKSVTVGSGNANGDLSWGKKNIWNNSKSDPGKLYDNSGKLISTYND